MEASIHQDEALPPVELTIVLLAGLLLTVRGWPLVDGERFQLRAAVDDCRRSRIRARVEREEAEGMDRSVPSRQEKKSLKERVDERVEEELDLWWATCCFHFGPELQTFVVDPLFAFLHYTIFNEHALLGFATGLVVFTTALHYSSASSVGEEDGFPASLPVDVRLADHASAVYMTAMIVTGAVGGVLFSISEWIRQSVILAAFATMLTCAVILVDDVAGAVFDTTSSRLSLFVFLGVFVFGALWGPAFRDRHNERRLKRIAAFERRKGEVNRCNPFALWIGRFTLSFVVAAVGSTLAADGLVGWIRFALGDEADNEANGTDDDGVEAFPGLPYASREEARELPMPLFLFLRLLVDGASVLPRAQYDEYFFLAWGLLFVLGLLHQLFAVLPRACCYSSRGTRAYCATYCDLANLCGRNEGDEEAEAAAALLAQPPPANRSAPELAAPLLIGRSTRREGASRLRRRHPHPRARAPGRRFPAASPTAAAAAASVAARGGPASPSARQQRQMRRETAAQRNLDYYEYRKCVGVMWGDASDHEWQTALTLHEWWEREQAQRRREKSGVHVGDENDSLFEEELDVPLLDGQPVDTSGVVLDEDLHRKRTGGYLEEFEREQRALYNERMGFDSAYGEDDLEADEYDDEGEEEEGEEDEGFDEEDEGFDEEDAYEEDYAEDDGGEEEDEGRYNEEEEDEGGGGGGGYGEEGEGYDEEGEAYFNRGDDGGADDAGNDHEGDGHAEEDGDKRAASRGRGGAYDRERVDGRRFRDTRDGDPGDRRADGGHTLDDVEWDRAREDGRDPRSRVRSRAVPERARGSSRVEEDQDRRGPRGRRAEDASEVQGRRRRHHHRGDVSVAGSHASATSSFLGSRDILPPTTSPSVTAPPAGATTPMMPPVQGFRNPMDPAAAAASSSSSAASSSASGLTGKAREELEKASILPQNWILVPSSNRTKFWILFLGNMAWSVAWIFVVIFQFYPYEVPDVNSTSTDAPKVKTPVYTTIAYVFLVLAEIISLTMAFFNNINHAHPVRRFTRLFKECDGVARVTSPREWPMVDIFVARCREPIEDTVTTLRHIFAIDWPKDRMHVYICEDTLFRERPREDNEAAMNGLTKDMRERADTIIRVRHLQPDAAARAGLTSDAASPTASASSSSSSSASSSSAAGQVLLQEMQARVSAARGNATPGMAAGALGPTSNSATPSPTNAPLLPPLNLRPPQSGLVGVSEDGEEFDAEGAFDIGVDLLGSESMRTLQCERLYKWLNLLGPPHFDEDKRAVPVMPESAVRAMFQREAVVKQIQKRHPITRHEADLFVGHPLFGSIARFLVPRNEMGELLTEEEERRYVERIRAADDASRERAAESASASTDASPHARAGSASASGSADSLPPVGVAGALDPASAASRSPRPTSSLNRGDLDPRAAATSIAVGDAALVPDASTWARRSKTPASAESERVPACSCTTSVGCVQSASCGRVGEAVKAPSVLMDPPLGFARAPDVTAPPASLLPSMLKSCTTFFDINFILELMAIEEFRRLPIPSPVFTAFSPEAGDRTEMAYGSVRADFYPELILDGLPRGGPDSDSKFLFNAPAAVGGPTCPAHGIDMRLPETRDRVREYFALRAILPRVSVIGRLKPTKFTPPTKAKTPRTHHVKAGNYDNVLFNERMRGHFIAMFDNDMRPHPFFLQSMMPLFYPMKHDPRVPLDFQPRAEWNDQPFPMTDVGWVQGPQIFVTDRDPRTGEYTSNEGMENGDPASHRNGVFFGAVQAGRDGHGYALFAGTNAIFRRLTVDSVLGIAYESQTEDAHTGNQIHTFGWTSAYIRKDFPYPIRFHDVQGREEALAEVASDDAWNWVHGIGFAVARADAVEFYDRVLFHDLSEQAEALKDEEFGGDDLPMIAGSVHSEEHHEASGGLPRSGSNGAMSGEDGVMQRGSEAATSSVAMTGVEGAAAASAASAAAATAAAAAASAASSSSAAAMSSNVVPRRPQSSSGALAGSSSPEPGPIDTRASPPAAAMAAASSAALVVAPPSPAASASWGGGVLSSAGSVAGRSAVSRSVMRPGYGGVAAPGSRAPSVVSRRSNTSTGSQRSQLDDARSERGLAQVVPRMRALPLQLRRAPAAPPVPGPLLASHSASSVHSTNGGSGLNASGVGRLGLGREVGGGSGGVGDAGPGVSPRSDGSMDRMGGMAMYNDLADRDIATEFALGGRVFAPTGVFVPDPDSLLTICVADRDQRVRPLGPAYLAQIQGVRAVGSSSSSVSPMHGAASAGASFRSTESARSATIEAVVIPFAIWSEAQKRFEGMAEMGGHVEHLEQRLRQQAMVMERARRIEEIRKSATDQRNVSVGFPLALGNVPEDQKASIIQRRRWALGAVQMLYLNFKDPWQDTIDARWRDLHDEMLGDLVEDLRLFLRHCRSPEKRREMARVREQNVMRRQREIEQDIRNFDTVRAFRDGVSVPDRVFIRNFDPVATGYFLPVRTRARTPRDDAGGALNAASATAASGAHNGVPSTPTGVRPERSVSRASTRSRGGGPGVDAGGSASAAMSSPQRFPRSPSRSSSRTRGPSASPSVRGGSGSGGVGVGFGVPPSPGIPPLALGERRGTFSLAGGSVYEDRPAAIPTEGSPAVRRRRRWHALNLPVGFKLEDADMNEPFHRWIWRQMFLGDSLLYPYGSFAALLYVGVALIFLWSGIAPLAITDGAWFLLSFAPVLLLRLLLAIQTSEHIVDKDDVWRSEQTWYSYAIVHMSILTGRQLEWVTRGGDAKMGGGVGGRRSMYAGNSLMCCCNLIPVKRLLLWEEWFNILLWVGIATGMIRNAARFFSSLEHTQPWTFVSSVLLGGYIFLAMRPMVMKSLQEVLGLKKYGSLLPTYVQARLLSLAFVVLVAVWQYIDTIHAESSGQ